MNALTLTDKLYGLAAAMFAFGTLIGLAWGRVVRRDRLEDEWDAGYDQRIIDERNVPPARDRGWDDSGADSATRAGRTEAMAAMLALPELLDTGRTVYPELVALGAQIDAEPPEVVLARLDETSEQWAARMDMEAAIWCAENGIERDKATYRIDLGEFAGSGR